MGKRLLHFTTNNSCAGLCSACPGSLASLGEDGSGAGEGQVVHRQAPARKTSGVGAGGEQSFGTTKEKYAGSFRELLFAGMLTRSKQGVAKPILH